VTVIVGYVDVIDWTLLVVGVVVGDGRLLLTVLFPVMLIPDYC